MCCSRKTQKRWWILVSVEQTSSGSKVAGGDGLREGKGREGKDAH
jgi:hypothetical protein